MITNSQTITDNPLYVRALSSYEAEAAREPFEGMLRGLESEPEDVTLYAAHLGNEEFLFTFGRNKGESIKIAIERLKERLRAETNASEVAVLMIDKANMGKTHPNVGTLTLRERQPEQSLAERV